MAVIGTVESLWRYPVKSMRGEQRDQVLVSFAGIYGDRLFAFKGARRPEGFREDAALPPALPASGQGRATDQPGRGGGHRAWAEPGRWRFRGSCDRRGDSIG